MVAACLAIARTKGNICSVCNSDVNKTPGLKTKTKTLTLKTKTPTLKTKTKPRHHIANIRATK